MDLTFPSNRKKFVIIDQDSSIILDLPENSLDALLIAAKKTAWGEKRHKFIILFTDAPTKAKINKKIWKRANQIMSNI